jgi:hypothetical protein
MLVFASKFLVFVIITISSHFEIYGRKEYGNPKEVRLEAMNTPQFFESFFHPLKTELVYREYYNTGKEAENSILNTLRRFIIVKEYIQD